MFWSIFVSQRDLPTSSSWFCVAAIAGVLSLTATAYTILPNTFGRKPHHIVCATADIKSCAVQGLAGPIQTMLNRRKLTTNRNRQQDSTHSFLARF